MKYDVIIIGGGLAGLTCGLRLSEVGKKVAVFSAGMSALHFSSGSLDLLGRNSEGRIVYDPLDELPDFLDQNPRHPYRHCGPDLVLESLNYLQAQLSTAGLELFANGKRNHFHVTAVGTLKPTFLSPSSVFNARIKAAFEKGLNAAILTFEGYRDFQPALAAANLKRHRLFHNSTITTGRIALPRGTGSGKPVGELRSMDIGRLFDRPDFAREMAGAIAKAAGGTDIVGLPACVGLMGYNRALRQLRELTGKIIYEAPTLPPSILGLRMDEALKTRLADLGGVYIAGDRVIGGKITNGRLEHVHTQNYGPARLAADHFVLATGSFFSSGLTSRFDDMREPIFGLKIHTRQGGRGAWSSKKFFDPGGHPFLSFGVETDESLNPRDHNGDAVENLFCAGAVLAHYDPVLEASGGGVAVATGYKAAEKILSSGRGGGQ